MTTTGLNVFDHTIQETNEWLKDLMYEMAWEDRHMAYKGMRAALQVLRDRLTPEEASHLGAQLPMLIRGIYYEGWNLSSTPKKIRDKKTFLAQVKESLDGETSLGQIDPEQLTRAVFKLLRHHVSRGQIKDVESELPKEIAELWPHDPNPTREQ